MNFDPNAPVNKEGQLINDPNSLIDQMKGSILQMQTEMQNTYAALGETEIIGQSHDKTITITMTATYDFKGIKVSPRALAGTDGKFDQKEFEWRLREAWKDVSKKIQETTQSKTIELLQRMQVPEEIKNIDFADETE